MSINKKKFFIFIVSAFFFKLLAEHFYYLDEDSYLVENFLKNNKFICSKVGDVEKVLWKEMTNFSGDENTKPYKEYLYYVEGSSSDIYIRLRLDKSCGTRDECFQIISIDRIIYWSL